MEELAFSVAQYNRDKKKYAMKNWSRVVSGMLVKESFLCGRKTNKLDTVWDLSNGNFWGWITDTTLRPQFQRKFYRKASRASSALEILALTRGDGVSIAKHSMKHGQEWEQRVETETSLNYTRVGKVSACLVWNMLVFTLQLLKTAKIRQNINVKCNRNPHTVFHCDLYHILLNYSSVDGHLGFLSVLKIKASMCFFFSSLSYMGNKMLVRILSHC